MMADTCVETAVYDFIEQCVTPAIEPHNIIRGWQNYVALPKDTNEYATYVVMSETRCGTNVSEYAGGELHELRESVCSVQIDFCSLGDNAMRRAACVNTLARGTAGAEFFKNYGIGCLYADDPKAAEYVDGEDIYVRRWSVTLHLSYWTDISIEMESFKKIEISVVKNVELK